ncbi:hepatitis A virus cellular receptor 1 homolog isoform X1 [Acanthochromis polyacanthus]|uniref:Hepatitis A virus cellular receptor 1 homolog n=1 Tax=Acanthochromis polyacanthus TaxID=80966 RepID=A0A3Q1GAM0_9TELE|nr:hepatitis A virus cellular receptor 1 homolog isoform X1 [Acanthochromis polyacanthus]
MLLLHIFTCVCLLSGVSAVTTETVVGVVGQTVMLPCRSEAANQRGVEVCWGRGEPSLFTCHNAVIDSSGERITYRKSYRFSLSSSSSLSISSSQPSDAGFYHCRLQLPGLFNDQTSSVHLIIIDPRPVFSSEPSKRSDDEGNLNAPWTTTDYITEGTDVTGSATTEPMVAVVQPVHQQEHINTLQMFVGNTVRTSFIVFIPALLLTAAYRVWRLRQSWETDRRMDQSEEGISSV